MLTLALETFRLSPVIHEAAEKPKDYFFLSHTSDSELA